MNRKRYRISSVALTATSNGCAPRWSDFYQEWVCTCKHGTHMGDQQCSIITKNSAQNRQQRKVKRASAS